MTRTEKTKYLIIGNSAGGIGAAEAIRGADKDGAITIVSDEPYPAYSRPLIAEHLADGYPLERMLYRSPDFYERNNIQAILGQKMTGLDVEGHAVGLEDGRKISWQKLLLAIGGSPIVPGIAGTDLNGVFTFTRLDDARAIDRFLEQYTRRMKAVIIGGGLIGVSAAEALVKRGVEVAIVEMKERVLNTILDEEASALAAVALRRAGVEIITGHTVDRISSYAPRRATGVSLDDSRPIPCEMVIIAIGVRPRTELVAEAGIEVNRGIVVDRCMATSRPDVYACGDVAEAYDFIYEENRLIPVWPGASIGGRIAGLNMAGVPAEYEGGTALNSVKYFGLSIVSAGMVTPPDAGYEVISDRRGDIYRKVVLKDGRIAGMVFAGDIDKSGIIYSLMKDRADVSRFKEVLVADDFGLASLPEEIWRPRLTAASLSPTSVEQPEAVIAGE